MSIEETKLITTVETDDNTVIKNFIYESLKLIPFLENDNLENKFKLIYP